MLMYSGQREETILWWRWFRSCDFWKARRYTSVFGVCNNHWNTRHSTSRVCHSFIVTICPRRTVPQSRGALQIKTGLRVLSKPSLDRLFLAVVYECSFFKFCTKSTLDVWTILMWHQQKDVCERKMFQFKQNVNQVDDWKMMWGMRPRERTFVCWSKTVRKEREIVIVQMLFSFSIFVGEVYTKT